MRLTIIIVLLGLVLSSGAQAFTTYKLLEVCRFDIDQYCPTVKKTLKKQIKECLGKKEDSLLPRCQNFYKEAK